jgi:hypothetical protein
VPYLVSTGVPFADRDKIYNMKTYDVFLDLLKFHRDTEAKIEEEKVRETERKNAAIHAKARRSQPNPD